MFRTRLPSGNEGAYRWEREGLPIDADDVQRFGVHLATKVAGKWYHFRGERPWAPVADNLAASYDAAEELT